MLSLHVSRDMKKVFLLGLSAPKSQVFFFAICDCDAHWGPQKSLATSETLHCDLGVRWKVASDLRFRVAISEAETSSFCVISGDLAPSTTQRRNR